MNHRLGTTRAGFTLTELLVVIGIMTMLMAIIVPAMQSLREGNKVVTCQFRLQQIGMALRTYHTDYKGVPPSYILETGGSPLDHSTVPADPSSEIADVNTQPYNNGLDVLFQLGYLTSRTALHCPGDQEHASPTCLPG